MQQVVHRDLKHSNILVTAGGHVKLLDFGIAKLMVSPTDDSGLTRSDAQWFTPEYAAPEQIENEPITTATDVYSLGMVLFSLLCGVRPNENVKSVTDAIREIETPAPTLRFALSQVDVDQVADRRGTTAVKLRQQLGGDLQVIVAKALKKVPTERYDTAQALGDEIRRYLNVEPIRARPDSWTYRTRTLLRRNRPQAIGIAAVAGTLVIGLITTTWQWRAAVRAEQRANSTMSLLTHALSPPDESQSEGALASLVELLRRAWSQTKQEFRYDSESKAKIALPLGLMLSTADDVATAAEALEASRQYMVAKGEKSSESYLNVLVQLGNAQAQLGDIANARAHLGEGLALAARLGKENFDKYLYAKIDLAMLEQQAGSMSSARQQLEEVARTSQLTPGEHGKVSIRAAQELENLSLQLCDGKQRPKPVLVVDPSDKQRMVLSGQEVARWEIANADYASAIRRYRELIPSLIEQWEVGGTETIYAYGWLSTALIGAGQWEEGERVITEAHRLASVSPDPKVRPIIEISLARQWLRIGRNDAAYELIRKGLEYFEAAGPAKRKEAERMRALLGEFMVRSNRSDEGLRILDIVRKNRSAIAGEGAYLRDAYQAILWRALATDIAHGPKAASPYYEEASKAGAMCMVPGHPDQIRNQLLLAYAALRSDGVASKRDEFLRILRSYRRALGRRADSERLSALESEPSRIAPGAANLEIFLHLMNY